MAAAAPRARAVVATGNRGKLEEIRMLLADCALELVPQAAFDIAPPAETGRTFLDNALLKARYASRLAGLPALADDSGLAVDALGGRPGVLSARFAGAGASDGENVERLLSELDGIDGAERAASFHCVAVLVQSGDDARPLIARGEWRGRILAQARGCGGFGYDPVFFDPVRGKSAAELSAVEKNRCSHRGQAFRELARLFAARDGGP